MPCVITCILIFRKDNGSRCKPLVMSFCFIFVISDIWEEEGTAACFHSADTTENSEQLEGMQWVAEETVNSLQLKDLSQNKS